MSESQQQTIFGESIDEHVHIETTGRTIRPFKRAIEQVAGEFKLQATDDGLSVRAVNTANVIMINVELPAEEFDAYDVDETTLGLHTGQFGSALQHTRYGKSTDDPVTIVADSEHLETETDRAYGETSATVTERVALTDPASIREEPDMPELDLGVEVDVSPEAFQEVLKTLDTGSSAHIQVGSTPSSVEFRQDQDLAQRYVDLDVEPTETSEFTWFTAEYLNTIGKVLNVTYADELTLRWDEDYPMIAEFSSPCGFTGEVMVAPRVKP